MPDDFDSPVSIADEHTRAAMSDADRNRLAESALDAAAAAGLPRTKGLTQVVYAAVNGLRVLGAINVGLADVGLELGALVRATALSGLATAHAATEGEFPAELIGDLGAIAADLDPGAGDDSDDDERDVLDAAELLEGLDEVGRRQVADALLDGAQAAELAGVLAHHLDDDEDADRVE